MDSKLAAILVIKELLPKLKGIRLIYNGLFYVNGIECTIDTVREVVDNEARRKAAQAS